VDGTNGNVGLVNAVDRVDLRCRKVCYDIDPMKQVAGKFFEVLNFADLIHFVKDSVQNGFNFFVRFLLEERPLALQTALVSEKLFLIEVGNPLLFYGCSFHEVPHYTLKFR
jgi:hypothetical protein